MSSDSRKPVFPSNPNFEKLRKQAKRRLVEFNSKGAKLQLSDAQQILAREYGFPNWSAMKREVRCRNERNSRLRAERLASQRAGRFRTDPPEPFEEQTSFQLAAAATPIGFVVCLLAAVLAFFLFFTVHAVAQSTPAGRNSTPQSVQMVTVDNDVRLEVLDWGGNGPPLIFLAGLGATAHTFDEFAPRFTAGHHVYGITRRGYGASSKPDPDDSNYSADRLGEDVLSVMDTLKLDRPVLVGWSLAGEELSWVATHKPDRVAGLIYLEGAYAYSYYAPGNAYPPGINLIIDVKDLRQETEALNSLWYKPDKARAAIDKLMKIDQAQLRTDLSAAKNLFKHVPAAPPMPRAPDPQSQQAKIAGAIEAGVEKFGTLPVPVLAIFATPKAEPSGVPAALFRYVHAAESASIETLIKNFHAGNPSAHIVRIANSQHAVFKSNPDQVEKAMDGFLATLH